MLDTLVIIETTYGSHLHQTSAAGRSLVKHRGIQARPHLTSPSGLNGIVRVSGTHQLPGGLGHQKPQLSTIPEGHSDPPLLRHWVVHPSPPI